MLKKDKAKNNEEKAETKVEDTEVRQEETKAEQNAASGAETDAETTETEAPSEEELLKAELEETKDKLLRKAAEFDNFKKRTAREKEDFYKFAVCDTIEKLLPVLDNLDRAIVSGEQNEDKEALLEGIKMVRKQFSDSLTGIGVEEIEAVGKEFDPEVHNAIMTEESDQDANTILEEFAKGYKYKDKVIRHSMVKVSS